MSKKITLVAIWMYCLISCVLSVCGSTQQRCPDLIPMDDYQVKHPYEHQTAYVRTGESLCKQEQAFLVERSKKVQHVLEGILQKTLRSDQVPRIALCGSGPGYCGMLAMLGALSGADTQLVKLQKRERGLSNAFDALQLSWFMKVSHYVMDLFGYGNDDQSYGIEPIAALQSDASLVDLCTYVAPTSGASWAIAGWMQANMPAKKYQELIADQMDEQLFEEVEVGNIVYALGEKKMIGQPLSVIDLYGALLSQKLLSKLGFNNPCDIDITLQRHRVATAELPLPLYSAVFKDVTMQPQVVWFEFTPYEVGSPWFKSFVPLWAFGRKFNAGVSQDFAPPQSLDFGLGIWGSGMAVNVKQLVYEILSGDTFDISDTLSEHFGPASPLALSAFGRLFEDVYGVDELLNDVQAHLLFDRQLLPARVWNWSYGMVDQVQAHQQELNFIDASSDCIVPVPLLFDERRAVDILIIVDACSGEVGKSLYRMQACAKKWNVPFPPLSEIDLTQPCSVHMSDTDDGSPVIIYVPLVSNQEYQHGWDPHSIEHADEYNVAYTAAQADLLSGLMEHAVRESTGTIVDVIRTWIERKDVTS